MRKIISCIIALCFTFVCLCFSTYAYVITNVNVGGFNVQLNSNVEGLLINSSALDVDVDTDLTNMQPCHNTEGINFDNQAGNVASCIVKLKSTTTNLTGLNVSNITLSGATSDEITKALRVMIVYAGEIKVFQPARDNTNIGSEYVGIIYADHEENCYIFIWYESTDTSCTRENVLTSSGGVSINIEFSIE